MISSRVRKNTFSVLVVKEKDGGYSGRCVELPGAISQGETLNELRVNMKDAINLVLLSIRKEAIEQVKDQHEHRQLIRVEA